MSTGDGLRRAGIRRQHRHVVGISQQIGEAMEALGHRDQGLDTRRVLGLSLAASLNAPLGERGFGVFRM